MALMFGLPTYYGSLCEFENCFFVLIIGRQFVGYIFFASFVAALLAKLEFLLVKVELKLKNFVLYLRHYIIMICLSIVN